MTHEAEIVAVVPSTELTGIEKTLVDVSRLTEQIAPLKKRAEELGSETPEDYRQLGAGLAETRALKKQGGGLFAPFEGVIDRAKTWLKIQKQKHEVICDETERIFLGKMKTYEQAEADAARAEQEALNKKNAKKGADPVTVRPNIPSTPGYRRSTVWRIEVTNIAAFLKASKERKDLRRFIILDEQALGAEARSIKDVAQFEALYPGVKCHKE